MSWTKQKQIGAGLVLLGSLLLLYIFIFLSYNVLIAKGIPELLPENETVFFAQFDLRNQHLFPPQKKLIEKQMASWISKTFRFDYTKDIAPFSTGLIGIAEIPNPVLIFETNQIEKYKNRTDVQIRDPYIIISPAKFSLALEETIPNNLASSFSFLQNLDGIPNNAFSYFFARGKHFELPWDTVGGFLMSREKGIFVSGRAMGNVSMPMHQNRYRANLLDVFPASPELFVGGSVLKNIFALDALEKKYGLESIELNDLQELFNDEYGFAVYKKDFLFASQGKIEFQTLDTIIPSVMSILKPALQTVTLPDGSKAKELVAKKENIVRSEEKIGENNIVAFRMKHAPLEITYGQQDDRFLLTSGKTLLEKTFSKQDTLLKSKIYETSLSEILRGVHEIGYFQGSFLKKFSPFFESFPSGAIGVRYGDSELFFFGFLEE